MNHTWRALKNLFFAAETTRLTTKDLEDAGIPATHRNRVLSECHSIYALEQANDRPTARARAQELCAEWSDWELTPRTSTKDEIADILSEIPR